MDSKNVNFTFAPFSVLIVPQASAVSVFILSVDRVSCFISCSFLSLVEFPSVPEKELTPFVEILFEDNANTLCCQICPGVVAVVRFRCTLSGGCLRNG